MTPTWAMKLEWKKRKVECDGKDPDHADDDDDFDWRHVVVTL